MDGSEVEGGAGNVGSEHESGSSECKTENRNCHDTEIEKQMIGMEKREECGEAEKRLVTSRR
jgi:hypothetical protein